MEAQHEKAQGTEAEARIEETDRPGGLPGSSGDIVRYDLGTVATQQQCESKDVTIEDEERRVIAALAKGVDLTEVFPPRTRGEGLCQIRPSARHIDGSHH